MERIERLQKRLPCASALIYSETARKYLTGFPSTEGAMLITREKAFLIVDFRYIEAARAAVKHSGCEVVLLSKQDNVPALAERLGVKSASIESTQLSVQEFKRLKKDLPGVAFDESGELDEILTAMRMQKDEQELQHIRDSQKITDGSFEHILSFIKPGVRETDLAVEIEYYMKKHGAQKVSFDLIVVSGEKTSLPHGVPGNRAVKTGDFVTMDIGAVYDGYCSDMTRTVAVGNISDEQKRLYDTVLKAQLEAEKIIRAGMVCRDVDKAARDIIEKDAGYEGCFGHGLGHSVGLEIHEEPRFSPACGTVLKEGMVMTVEPGVYLEGRFGARIEDMVAVTADGCENLTKSQKALIIL